MKNTIYELTNPQKNIWNTELYYNNTNINNICANNLFLEKINIELLKKAIEQVIEENDNFHTRIMLKNGKVYQYYEDKLEYEIEVLQIKDVEELQETEEKILSQIFDVLESNLFTFKIFQYPDKTGGIITNVHHLIADSWTMGLVADKIAEKYRKLCKNEEIEPANTTYKDYIITEKKYKKSDKFKKDRIFWKKYLNKLPDTVTVPSFKMQEQNSDKFKNSKRKTLNFNNDLIEKIKEYCKEHNISVYAFFLSVYSIYIGRINNSNDFIIGTPILNRTSAYQKNTMGMFVNTAPVRVQINDDVSFTAFLNNMSVSLTSIYRHQKYSYQYILEDLRKKDPKLPNLYNVLLSYQITKMNTVEDNKLKYKHYWNSTGYIADDMDIHIYDVDNTGKLNISYDYKTSKYNEDDVLRIHDRITYMAEQIISNQAIFLKEISITTPIELKEILQLSQKSECKYPSDKTITQLFEEQVEKTPNNVAIKYKDSYLTYDELNRKANQLAHFLREKGIKPNDVVALRLNKSLEMVVGIFRNIKSRGLLSSNRFIISSRKSIIYAKRFIMQIIPNK